MIEKVILDNGVRIVWERVPAVRSVAVGIWVGTGSRSERAGENGAAHFIEHMVFKGTESRTAGDIAVEMDAIGGQMNAFTTKENTCFYARVLGEHLNTALDVLSDMFFSSRFDEKDVENERGVILEEIDMYQDTPEDLVSEELFARVFRGTPLGRPILGKKSTLASMTGAFLKDYMARHYLPGETVVALSGDVPEGGIDYIRRRFSAMPARPAQKPRKAAYRPGFTVKKKAIEQNHICLAFPGLTATDPDRYAMRLLLDILGGGMSSRLFQELREKRGLCYSVYAFNTAYADTGLNAVYAALSTEQEFAAIGAVLEEIRRLREGKVTEAELSRVREQAKANVLMSVESTAARMNRLGRNELVFGSVPEVEDVIESYNAVTRSQLYDLAQKTFDFGQISFSAVGRVHPAEDYQARIAALKEAGK